MGEDIFTIHVSDKNKNQIFSYWQSIFKWMDKFMCEKM